MIREGVAASLKKILGTEQIPFNIPPNPDWGDFSSAVCSSVAKQRRQSPVTIAQETAAELRLNLPPYIHEVTITPPFYLNFKVDWPGLAQDLIPEIFKKGDLFGRPLSVKKEKVFIEHTSVNPNKTMHIGHLRNAVLGDTVARVLEWLGFSTEVCNYIDDTGLQVVDVVTALLYLDLPRYSGEASDFEAFWAKAPKDQPFDYFCWDPMPVFKMDLKGTLPSLKRGKTFSTRSKGVSIPLRLLLRNWLKRLSEPIWKRSLNFPSSTIFLTGNRISSAGGSGRPYSHS